MTVKVILIRPENSLGYYFDPPLGCMSVASVLKNKHNVVILDAKFESKNKILDECEDADLVGISAMTSEVGSGVHISDMIKNEYDVPIVWGGIHATLFPEITSNDNSVDCVIVGEGEELIIKVLNMIKNRKKLPSIIKSNRFVKLDSLPMVAYDLLDMERYVYHSAIDGRKIRMLPYQSSRGCPHRCAFCINPTIGNSLWRTKSTKKIVDEVEILVKNYNLDAINFVDDNFFVNRQRVIEICKEIIRRNLVFNWVAECRADYFGKIVDDNLLDLAVKAGLNGLTIGFESGSPRILRLIKKDITIQDSLRAVKMCVKHNIEIDMAFMIGIPGETKKDVEQTLSLINEFKQICPNSRVGLSVFRIYPGNELSKKIFRTGLLEEPKSLRDWCDPKYQAFYTTGFADDKWVENISFYYQLATSNLPQTFSAIKKGRLLFLPRLFFIMLAKQRVKKSFFDITLDKFLYNKAFNFYLNMREKLNRFNR